MSLSPDKPDQNLQIPEIFRSFMTGSPFEKCISCEKELLLSGADYMVEKAIKKADVIIEYAMCMDCMQRKYNQLSIISREKIGAYFAERADPEKRIHELLEKHGRFSVDGWLEECMLSGQARSDMEEYTVVGAFRGGKMLLGPMPYVIGFEARGEMATLLSQKTKDEMDRFVDDNFGLPPELRELLKDRELIFI